MVTKKPKGLGRGLEALLGPALGDAPAEAAGQPASLPLAALLPGIYQPRTRMDEGALYELAESIRAQGVMQPVLVRPLADARAQERLAAQRRAASAADTAANAGQGDAAQLVEAEASYPGPWYEIIAGERRVRASRIAGLDAVPVLVRDVPDEAAAVMALIENIQREDLNPLEEAQGLARLVSEFGLTHEQAAQAVGRSRSAASNLLRLLNLAEPVQTLLMAGDIDMGHARALLALDRATQITAGHEIAAKKLSVREAEALVKKLATAADATPAATRAPQKSSDWLHVEQELSDLLMATVTIRLKKRAAGELAISFGSLDALDGLIERLRGGQG
ncbi:ParB/RepB/Spo0J family partition protein [Extensimonas sp. H3M7-6]|uniref:ParB/RepB/Spo0J family partition protein n=1 Tax=Extensimonas soli TaxID=3031322 RepID=UPI0023D9F98D|nr:ParB/RepB/Spo0J family partition protein [Extensimonas sp. H3M7-6]MDF1481991.1 ParB/RepB/Spo0J family partition protein [Extensimonas sp. H3M7-6]